MEARPDDIEKRLAEAIQRGRTRGAEYVDARFMVCGQEIYQVKNGAISKLEVAATNGLGVRVLVGGYWGFAATPGAMSKDIDALVDSAIELAKAARLTNGEPLKWVPGPAYRGTYRSPVSIHPAGITPDTKIALLLDADSRIASLAEIKTRRSHLGFYYTDKWFANSEGSFIEQSIVESGGSIYIVAVGNGDAQLRAYPELMGDEVQSGWEFIERLDLPGNARRTGEEAVALLTADECPSGEIDVILGGSQLALQVHESCGHPSELDRVLGVEADVAGTSFLTLDGLGSRKYGSPEVTITADATLAGGLGSFGWDDEGTPAQCRTLIDRGIHSSYLTSRQYTLPDGNSGGNARACDWAKPPIVRMTNINLLPGTASLPDIIADTKYGLYFDGQKTWSIDDRRLNFAFGCQAAWEIVNGKVGRLLKNPSYTGITPVVWGSCDAVAGPESWRIWGLTGCGKGAPMQNLHVGHGTSQARFRRLKVGVSR